MTLATIVLLTLVTVLGVSHFGQTIWVAELFSHWVMQYFAVAAILYVFFYRKKAPYRMYLSIAAVLYCVYLMMGSDAHHASLVQINSPKAQVRIFEFNTRGRTEAIANWLPPHAASYDVVVLLETGLDYEPVLEKLKSQYPFQVSHLDNSPFGIAILSRFEIVDRKEFTAEGGFYPQFELTLKAPTEDRFLLYAMHVPPPFAPQLAEAHEVILGELIEKLQQKKYAAVVVGDLNMTQYSKHYAKLLRLTGLRDTAGLSPANHSWPSYGVNLFSPLGIRIDHCLVSATFSLVDRQRLEDLKSDHLPFKCTLQIEK
ncbi:MAG: endonuclease/exonuclease/phosphatase family protein [Bdellovibrionaceae bacterium]|nr:endonuclease/exonuclease/phosphatase family protein [Pseudobdellovibrionaceae bacterium]